MKHVFTLFLLTCFVVSKSQLKITAGTQLVNSGSIVLGNISINNNGTFDNNNSAVVIIRGDQNISISGTGVTKFYMVELDKNSGAVSLQKNISVAGPLKFTKGSVDLTNNNIELVYPGGLLVNESEQNRIYTLGAGEIFITQTLNTPVNINPGNLGAVITSSQNLGATAIRRGHQVQTNNSQQQSIRRYFQIDPTNNSNGGTSLRFQYFDAELNNLTEPGLVIFKKDAATDWMLVGKDVSDINTNFVEKNSMPSLQKFSLFSSVAAPLPLKLLAFDAKCKEGNVLLQWMTANEVNTKQFVIEKSKDGNKWLAIETTPAKGNTLQYTYSSTITPGDASFLRLKMEDDDGKFTYSPVQKIDCNNTNKIVVGPNPTKGNLTISATVNQSTVLNITVVDMNGRTVLSKQWKVKTGLNSQTIDLYSQPSSAYLIVIKGGGVNEMVKMIKQ